jgi:hypothetical protein
MKTPNPIPKARTCQVNRPRWARLVGDQPECKKTVAIPTAALCPRHEKLLPKGWRKLDAERPRAKAAKAETKPAARKPRAK